MLVRWPGKIAAGSVSNEIIRHNDWLPTFSAMAGEPDIKDKLLKGHKAGDKTFKVHLDGYNLVPYLIGREKNSPRKGSIYFDDDGDLVALRFDNWKLVFMEQRAPGTLRVLAEPFTPLRLPRSSTCRPPVPAKFLMTEPSPSPEAGTRRPCTRPSDRSPHRPTRRHHPTRRDPGWRCRPCWRAPGLATSRPTCRACRCCRWPVWRRR